MARAGTRSCLDPRPAPARLASGPGRSSRGRIRRRQVSCPGQASSGRRHRAASHEGIPRVVFADPEIAAVGLTAAQAAARSISTATAEISVADAADRSWTYERDVRSAVGPIADRDHGVLAGGVGGRAAGQRMDPLRCPGHPRPDPRQHPAGPRSPNTPPTPGLARRAGTARPVAPPAARDSAAAAPLLGVRCRHAFC